MRRDQADHKHNNRAGANAPSPALEPDEHDAFEQVDAAADAPAPQAQAVSQAQANPQGQGEQAVYENPNTPDAAEVQARLHAEQDHRGRIRASWKDGQADSLAKWMGRALIMALLSLFAWQSGARIWGHEKSYGPRAAFDAAAELIQESVTNLFAWLQKWFNILKFLENLWDIISPFLSDIVKVFGALASFAVSMWKAMVEGLFSNVDNVAEKFMIVGGGLLVSVLVLIILESCGITFPGKFGKVFRPSFWAVSMANTLYEMSRFVMQIYGYFVRLVLRFQVTLNELLQRFPVLLRIFRTMVEAGKYVVLGLKDLLLAIPHGINKAVDVLARSIKMTREQLWLLLASMLVVTCFAAYYGTYGFPWWMFDSNPIAPATANATTSTTATATPTKVRA